MQTNADATRLWHLLFAQGGLPPLLILRHLHVSLLDHVSTSWSWRDSTPSLHTPPISLRLWLSPDVPAPPPSQHPGIGTRRGRDIIFTPRFQTDDVYTIYASRLWAGICAILRWCKFKEFRKYVIRKFHIEVHPHFTVKRHHCGVWLKTTTLLYNLYVQAPYNTQHYELY